MAFQGVDSLFDLDGKQVRHDYLGWGRGKAVVG